MLSYSSLIFAEFTYSQTLEDFIRSHVNMFNFFGGLTKFIIIDNLKSGVTKAHDFDPVINQSFNDLCKHYGIVVDPARVRRPQDKPVVEKAVDIIQKDFFPRVRNKTYTSLFELNSDLKDFLKVKNKEVMKDRGKSRLEFFEKEKIELNPLPINEYQIFYFKKAKVHPDCHIQFEKNFYSVPYKYVGKEVSIKYNSKIIHILYGLKHLASHTLRRGSNQRATKTEHYPEKKIVEMNYIIQGLLKKASKIGEKTLGLMNKLIMEERHPLKNLRKAQSILKFKEVYGVEALEHGSDQALRFEKMSYHYIKSCCKNFNEIKLKTKSKNLNAPKRLDNFICLQGGQE